MFDLIAGLGGQILWIVVAVGGGLIAFWGYGWKKKREGRAEERERAAAARRAAAEEARQVRDETGREPIDEQRDEVKRWER